VKNLLEQIKIEEQKKGKVSKAFIEFINTYIEKTFEPFIEKQTECFEKLVPVINYAIGLEEAPTSPAPSVSSLGSTEMSPLQRASSPSLPSSRAPSPARSVSAVEDAKTENAHDFARRLVAAPLVVDGKTFILANMLAEQLGVPAEDLQEMITYFQKVIGDYTANLAREKIKTPKTKAKRDVLDAKFIEFDQGKFIRALKVKLIDQAVAALEAKGKKIKDKDRKAIEEKAELDAFERCKNLRMAIIDKTRLYTAKEDLLFEAYLDLLVEQINQEIEHL
jgi:hypothetical protein